MKSLRRDDLDAAKGWGMLFVVLGHAAPPDWVGTLIYGFHMPLFFLISGHLWKGSLNLPSVFRSLMWPFWWGSLATWFVWLAKAMLFKSDGVPLWGPLLATAYGGDLFGYLVHNSALWFLPALFSMFTVVLLLMRFKASRVTLAVSLFTFGGAVLLAAPSLPVLRTLPLSLGQGLVGGIFFAIGWLVAGSPLDRVRMGLPWFLRTLMYVGGLVLFVVLVQLNGRVDLFSMQFGHPALYLFNGLLGSTLLLVFCRQPLAQWSPIRAIGARSLRVLVFHQPLLWILRFVIAKLQVQSNCFVLTVVTLMLFLIAFKALDLIACHTNRYSMLETKS